MRTKGMAPPAALTAVRRPADTVPNTGDEPFISKPETARRLGVCCRTLTRWMRRGVVPFYKPGRDIKFRWSEVQARLAQVNCVDSVRLSLFGPNRKFRRKNP